MRLIRQIFGLEVTLLRRGARRTFKKNSLVVVLAALVLYQTLRTAWFVGSQLDSLPTRDAIGLLLFWLSATFAGMLVLPSMTGQLAAESKLRSALHRSCGSPYRVFWPIRFSISATRQLPALVPAIAPIGLLLAAWQGLETSALAAGAVLLAYGLIAPSLLHLAQRLWWGLGWTRSLVVLGGVLAAIALLAVDETLLAGVVGLSPPAAMARFIVNESSRDWTMVLGGLALAALTTTVIEAYVLLNHDALQAPATSRGRRGSVAWRGILASGVWKELVTLSRWRRAHGIAVVAVLVAGVATYANLPEVALMGPILYCLGPLLLWNPLLANGLSVDGPGLTRLRLQRLDWSQIWNAKETVHLMVLVILEIIVCLIAWIGSSPKLTTSEVAVVGTTLVGFFFWQSIVARVIGVVFFEPRDPRRISGDYVAPAAALFQSVASAVFLVPVVAVVFLTDTGRISILAALAVTGSLLLAAAALRPASYKALERLADQNWDALLHKGNGAWLTR